MSDRVRGKWALTVFALLVLVEVGACAELEPGVEARLGLSASTPSMAVHLGLQEARLRPCASTAGEAPGVLERLGRWLGPSTAWAHGDPGADRGSTGPRIAGPTALELAPGIAWLPSAPVGRGPYCGVTLRLAPPGAAGSSFELDLGARRIRSVVPADLDVAFPAVRALGPGTIAVHLEVDTPRLAEAVEDAGDERGARAALRTCLRAKAEWSAR